jgi:hypothetical protein
MGALFVSSTSVFVSCKDYDDDINALQLKQQSLEQSVAQKEAAILSAINELKSVDNELKAKDAELAAADALLKKAIEDLETAHNKDVADLKARDQELDQAILKAQAAAEAASKLAQDNYEKNAAAIKKVADDLGKTNEAVAALQESLEKAWTKLDKVATDLNTAEKNIGNLQDSVKTAYKKIADLEAALIAQKAELLKAIEDGDKALDAKITINKENIQKNADAIKNIVEVQIPKLQQDLIDAEARLQEDINGAKERITKAEADIVKLGQDIERIDGELNVIRTILSSDLRSLVFIPYTYVDGIEAIAYPWFTIEEYLTNRQSASPAETFDRPARYGETQPVNAPAKLTVPKSIDYVIDKADNVSAASPVTYLPEIGVDYHMNPSTANTKYADLIGFAQHDSRYTETTTRAAGDLVVLAEKNEKSGYKFFNNKAGVLSTGLKVTDIDELIKKENYVVALQSKTSMADVNITSDYAQVYPEHVTKLSIAWAKENNRVDDTGAKPVNAWDEDCEGVFADADTYHKVSKYAKHMLFDTPKEALLASPSVFVAFNDAAGVSLGSYLQTCFDREGNQGGDQYHAAWPFKDEEKYGFHYVFNIVSYGHVKNLNDGSGNNTGAVVMEDDKYAHLKGDTIIANAYNSTDAAATETAIGREPLVQVLLMHGDKVVKDGYILCRITADLDNTKEVEKYPEWTKNFDNCNGLTFKTPEAGSNPSGDRTGDFDKLIIQELLNNEFDFLTFNGLYDLDGGLDNATIYTTNNVGVNATPDQYVYTQKNGTTRQIAQIALTTVKKSNGKDYSYKFTITMDKDQVEACTHDQNADSYTPTFYIRWTAKNIRAPYKHIYMRLQVTINRSIASSGIKEKLDNYWYGLDGSSAGWDAIVFNVKYPEDNTDINTWSNSTRRTFQGNEEKFTTAALNNNDKKYFFIPQNTQITDLEGTTWIITPAYGDDDLAWKTLDCEKNVKDTHVWPLTDKADATYRVCNGESATDLDALKNLMTWCNIAFNGNVLSTNKFLYAVKKNDYHNGNPLYHLNYTKIAELNQTTGEVTLVRTWTGDNNTCAAENPLDMVLNAVGYGANHSKLTQQFHAWTGLVAENGCDVAVFTFAKDKNETFGIWTSSWERPINLVNDKPKDEYEAVKDAQSNGYFIPIYDLLAFYDWRGPVEGDMEKANTKWLWAYYNINRIEADLNPAHVTTTLHGGKLGSIDGSVAGTTLASLTGEVRLYPATAAQKSAVKAAGLYNFPTLIGGAAGQWNKAAVSADLVTYLEGAQNGKANFGYIYYENNGQNVDEFVVRIPLNIYYEWGHFRTYVDVKINTTLGN